eukprot:g40861.t1
MELLFESLGDWWETVKANIKRFFILKRCSEEASKIFFWSRVRSMEQGEMCSHIFFQKEHKESPVLGSLKEEDGLVTSSQSDILMISKSFYARLYDMKPTDCMASHSFLSSTTEVLDDSTWEMLDQ